MDMLLLVGILVLNVLISLWNCYAAGIAWKDTMTLGGWFEKLLVWSAVIQAGVGFSMPILLGLSFGATAHLTSGQEPALTPEQGQQLMQSIFALWYVAVILPILGTGLAITAHSLKMAYQRRDFASIAAAGWNTFAQIHNTVSAVNNLGGAFGDVGKLFGKAFEGKGDSKNKVIVLVFVLVLISLIGGFAIAFGLTRYFARTSQSRIEEYASLRRKERYA